MEIITEDMIDFSAYLKETDAQQNVRPAHEYVGELLNDLKNPDQTKKVYLPWDGTRDDFKIRPGETTLWAGTNGHGKSLVTGMVAMSLMAQNEKVCIASFEMKPKVTLQRMLRQYAESNPFSYEYQGEQGIAALTDIYNEFADWTKGRLWLYDQQGTVKADQVIAVGRYCAKELGVTQYFVDSLSKCGIAEDDYNGQKNFVDELTSMARDNNIHAHLVHHLKKLSTENEIPGKFDSKGSGAIVDMVDNMMIVWRNKAKEDRRRDGKQLDPKDSDAAIFCRKQRNGDDEPMIKLWYDRDSTQFVAYEGARPLYMPLYPHQRTQ